MMHRVAASYIVGIAERGVSTFSIAEFTVTVIEVSHNNTFAG
jgi:hypothetical protein